MNDQERRHATEQMQQPDSEELVVGKVVDITEATTTQIRHARIEKALRKAEIVNALREAKVKHRIAISAEKNAAAKEARARKLAKKAEAAKSIAMHARSKADELCKLAAMAENAVKNKHAELVDAVAKLRLAQKLAKKARKLENKQQKADRHANKQSAKTKMGRNRKLNGLKTVDINSP